MRGHGPRFIFLRLWHVSALVANLSVDRAAVAKWYPDAVELPA
jgi:hypothetical protein